MIFYNRKEELKALNNWWKGKGSQLAILYGKRRVGKTSLALKFIENKQAIYFLADKLDINLQLKKLSQQIGQFFKDNYVAEYGIADWEQLFKYIAKQNKKFVLVIDEFPYLEEARAGVASVFQKGWDLYLKDSPTFLILSGSSIGMMEKYTLNYQAPLYGRRSGQILVEPFSFFELEKIFSKMNFEQRLELFSITGGTIAYLKPFIEYQKNIWKGVSELILQKEKFLYQEVEFILREELREPNNYFSILLAISLGKRKMSKIINETGFSKSTVSSYLAILEKLKITKREVPVTEKNYHKGKKGLYSISDPFFVFWFRYIFRNKYLLESGKSKEVLTIIKKGITEQSSYLYEKISQEFILRNMVKYHSVGGWWNKNEEIDVVGINNDTKEIIFGECKWTNKKVGTNVFEDLKRKARLVDWNMGRRIEKFILFSKSGFTKNMVEVSKREKVILVQGDKFVM